MIEPVVLLPSQWADRLRRPVSSEWRLIAAIMIDAVDCFTSGSGRAQAEAEVWLMSTSRDWPFSFENLCDAMRIDAGSVRAALRRWRAQNPSMTEISARDRRHAERIAMQGSAA